MEETKKRKGAPSTHLFVPNEVHLLVINRVHLVQTNISDLARGRECHFRTGKRAVNLDTTLFRLPVLALPFSPSSSGRHFAGFPVAIKTPRICVNCALINEIILFGIISELISRITRSLSLFYSVYLRKFTATLILYSRKETRSLASDPRFHAQLPFFVIELGFKQRKGVFFYTFLKPCIKTLRMGCC